jgi:hypothetical protein
MADRVLTIVDGEVASNEVMDIWESTLT